MTIVRQLIVSLNDDGLSRQGEAQTKSLLNQVFQLQERTPSIPEKLYIEMHIGKFTDLLQ